MAEINYEMLKDIPFLFSQTREDSEIELNSITKFKNSNLLLVGSAGDTILNILSVNNSIANIDIIDANTSQLKLTKLKLALYLKYNDQLDQILNNKNKKLKKINYKCIINDLYINKLLDIETKNYWYENINYLINGINFEGRLEKLFKIVNDDSNFDLHLSNSNLKLLFGKKSIQYSKKKSFSDHFKEINKKYENCDNYFKQSFKTNSYLNDLPLYFKTKCKINPTINYYLNKLVVHCENSASEIYDVISISNITDWMNPSKFQNLFDNIFRILKKNGVIVSRRLNSDTSISDYLNCNYKKNYTFKIEKSNDSSEFYSETIIITKI